MDETLAILKALSDNFFVALALVVLAISTFLSILEWTGLMPSRISRRLFKNRMRETLEILGEMGVDFKKQRQSSFYFKLKSYFSNDDENAKKVKELINNFLKKGQFTVGKTRQLHVNEFADLMSGSCDPNCAISIARCLSTHIKMKNEITDFDFVVTPKSGSPIIGYEFAKLVGKPFVLHDCNETKYTTDDESLSLLSRFDSAIKLEQGKVGLIIDDSTTGGRKVLMLAEDLRRLGCVVSDCLVAFEPQGKQGGNLLTSSGIRLHSIIKR